MSAGVLSALGLPLVSLSNESCYIYKSLIK